MQLLLFTDSPLAVILPFSFSWLVAKKNVYIFITLQITKQRIEANMSADQAHKAMGRKVQLVT